MKWTVRISLLSLSALTLLAPASPANAQLLQRQDLSAAMAMTLAETAIATCKAIGYNISVTVVGRNAEPIVQIRGDHTGPHTTENSFRKAYTARTFRAPSGALEERFKKDPTLGVIHLNHVIAGRGALPIKVADDTIGAAGASGAPGGDKDEACIQAGLDKIADQLK